MRTTLWLGVIFSTSALVACGGGGDDPVDAPVNPNIDAPQGTADASPDGRPDADPLAPDAAPAWACNGQPNPTTALDPVDIAGTTVELSASGTTPVPNATIDLFVAGGTTPIATTTSAGAAATFTFDNIATGGTAVDGYMRGTFPGGGTRKVVYVFPPQPIHDNLDNALVTTASDGLVIAINLLYAEPDQAPTNGAVGILVTDCLGIPLEGATVSTNPAGSQVLYRNAAGDPDTTMTSTGPDGIGIVFNVPPGDSVVVDASYQGYDMRQHTIFVRTLGLDPEQNSLSTTIVMP